MQFFILTIIVAIIGGAIGLYFKIPAGALLGALIAVSIYNIIWDIAYVPDNIRVFTRIIAGTLIGSRMTRKDVHDLKNIFASAGILILSMVIFFPAVGYLIFRLSNLDLSTSLFASAPGGMSDMALVADELGADAPKVVLMQLLRILFILGFFPLFLRAICKRYKLKECENVLKETACTKDNILIYETSCTIDKSNAEPYEAEGIVENKIHISECKSGPLKSKIGRSIITVLIGVSGGLIGVVMKLPAGAMIGSVVAVGCANVLTGCAFMTPKVRRFTQIVIGAVLGSSITMHDVIGMKDIVVPGIILVISMIFLNLLVGYIIFRFSKLDLMTALFASTPGGVTEMVLVADELGADAPKVALLQLIRLISVIIIFPVLLRFLSSLW